MLNLHSCLLIVQAKEDEAEYATFSWAETTYSTSSSRVWNDDSIVLNYTGSYSDIFTITDHYINSSDSTYMEEKRIVNYEANYSYSSNFTRKGYLNIDIDVDVYTVNVDYGDGVQLVWMALKKGSYEMDYFREAWGSSYEYEEENHQIIDREIKKYDRHTLELLDAWNSTEELYDTLNYSVSESYILDDHINISSTFTMPFFLVFQIYTTEKGDRIAWASTFSEFLVFGDKNGDAIYTVGDDPSGAITMASGSEYSGRFLPSAMEYEYSREGSIMNSSASGGFPIDKKVNEIASSIAFKPPILVGNDTVTWNINYRDYPIDAVIGNNKIPDVQWIRRGHDPLYNNMLPSDFYYGFDYKIGGGQADLALTLVLPELSNLDPYNIMENYNFGLSIPRYNYFLSSFDIKEKNPKEITVPSDKFMFESNNETVAEVNLINPVKKNYTLYDYPSTGETITTESRGASVNNLVLVYSRFQGHIGLPETNLLYTIEDLVSTIPGFTVVDNLYHVHTENYPVWAGKKLVHDPTNTIYFENITLPFRVTADSIPGFDIFIISSSVSFVVLVITLKRKKFKKK